jgi:hypothetical protein
MANKICFGIHIPSQNSSNTYIFGAIMPVKVVNCIDCRAAAPAGGGTGLSRLAYAPARGLAWAQTGCSIPAAI